MLLRKYLLQNQTQETNTDGSGAANSTQTAQTANSLEEKGNSDNKILNDMYKQEEEGQTKDDQSKSKDAEVKQTQEGTQKEEGAKSATGYGDESGKSDAESKEQKSEDTKKTEIEFNAEGLNDDGKQYVKEFAEKHKLSKEATQAFADQYKTQVKMVAEYQANQAKIAEEKTKAIQSEWDNQLKTDKDFGGENFKQNLKRVDTVIDKLMPNTKNLLVTMKGKLPPQMMKDLLNIHNQLLAGNDKIVTGQEGVKDSSDPAAFLADYYK